QRYSLHCALLPVACASWAEPAPLPRGSIGELLGRAGGGLSPAPQRRVGHGRARRLRPGLSRPVRFAGGHLGRARGSPSQVPWHLRSHRSGPRGPSPPLALTSQGKATPAAAPPTPPARSRSRQVEDLGGGRAQLARADLERLHVQLVLEPVKDLIADLAPVAEP